MLVYNAFSWLQNEENSDAQFVILLNFFQHESIYIQDHYFCSEYLYQTCQEFNNKSRSQFKQKEATSTIITTLLKLYSKLKHLKTVKPLKI